KASGESRLFIIAYVRRVFMKIYSVGTEPQKLKELVYQQNDFLRRMKCSYQKMFRYEKTDSRVQISALISPEARNALRKMAKKNNLTQAEMLDKLILSADRLFMQKTAGDYSR
ncbi:TPA: replication regulatory RepB family protein, partial [Escherichia coli]|nr:replication regulatory RepB family protein [Escherichia coli]HBH5195918.1 replication regulatory RepB family protein [Escherichia coli]HDP8058101.1 replication regulatory RepB family protein [Escherichia coli]